MGTYMSKQRKIWREANESKANILLIQKGRHIDDTSRLSLVQLYFKSSNLLLYIKNNRSTFALQNEGSHQSQNAVRHSESTRPTGHERPPPHKVVILRLMEDFATRKSSNEHGFFVVVTSLIKIGEGRIRDFTGDTSFPMTFKYLMQRPSKGEILAETVTQFPIYVDLNSTSLQLSGLSWINNHWLLLELVPVVSVYSSY